MGAILPLLAIGWPPRPRAHPRVGAAEGRKNWSRGTLAVPAVLGAGYRSLA